MLMDWSNYPDRACESAHYSGSPPAPSVAGARHPGVRLARRAQPVHPAAVRRAGAATDAEPLRVLHLSDLHMMPDQRRKQDWVAVAGRPEPDLVVVTGDNMAHPDAVPGVLRALRRCSTARARSCSAPTTTRGPG